MAIYTSGLLCERVLVEGGDLYTAVRIVDSVDVQIPEVPAGLNVLIPPYTFNAILIFKSDGPETFTVSIRSVDPDGRIGTADSYECSTGGGSAGHKFNVVLKLGSAKEGQWWFDVYVNDVRTLRLPFRVTHTQVAGYVMLNRPEHEQSSPPPGSSI
jgi:hypothetical protein